MLETDSITVSSSRGKKEIRPAKRKSIAAKKNASLTVLVLPALVMMMIFQYAPMPGIILAFKDYNFIGGIFGSPWVGLKNFNFIFKTADAMLAFKNTLVYNSLFIVTVTVGCVILAILLNEILSRGFLKFYQTSIFLPYFLSMTIVAYIVFALLDNGNGMVNSILASLGASRIDWYFEPQYWTWIHVIIHFWKYMGYTSLLYYAYVISIDPSYYEAAKIDGAGRLQMARFITIPNLMPIIIITFLGALGRIFNADFGQFFLVPMESPMLLQTSSVLDTYVYSALKGSADIGMGAAAGLFQSTAGFALVMIVNMFIRKKFGRERAMF